MSGWKEDRVTTWFSLNLIDLMIIVVAVEMGLAKANPIICWLAGNLGALIGYKICLSLAVIFLLAWLTEMQILKWLNIVMAVIIVWNVAWLLV